MAHENFDYRYFIHAPADQIYAHFAEPTNYIGLSPLIVAVYGVEHDTNAEGQAVVRYVSVERFRFLGFIRYDNHIRVTMTLTRHNEQIVSDVDSPLWVKVRFVFNLQPENGGTAIHETVSAQMPGFLHDFVVGQAKSVQQARARILTSRMEQQAAP